MLVLLGWLIAQPAQAESAKADDAMVRLFAPSAISGAPALVEGSVAIGVAPPGSLVRLDGKAIPIDGQGRFLIGFGFGAPSERILMVTTPDGSQNTRTLAVEARSYQVQRIDNLASSMVTPAPDLLHRIRLEAEQVRMARTRSSSLSNWQTAFQWPVKALVTGVFGTKRILNGQPRSPHYGYDLAASTGTPIYAPAGGRVLLVEDLYFSGLTLLLDHGAGLISAFLHLHDVAVSVHDVVRYGQVIGFVGNTGRSTGAHLDWRVSWFDQRVDAALLIDRKPVLPGARVAPRIMLDRDS
ncbi:MAG: M23 family metallopeptidase [Pseudomonadota bacterium]